MGEGIGDQPQLLDQLFDPLEHGVDCGGDHRELGALGALVEPMREISGRDPGSDSAYRPRPPLRDPKNDVSADEAERKRQQQGRDERLDQRCAHAFAVVETGADQQQFAGRQSKGPDRKGDRLSPADRVELEFRPIDPGTEG